jgi:hypothetical protein
MLIVSKAQEQAAQSVGKFQRSMARKGKRRGGSGLVVIYDSDLEGNISHCKAHIFRY